MTAAETDKLDNFMRWIMRGVIAGLLAITAYFLMRVVERQDTIAETLTRVAQQQAITAEQVQHLEERVKENRIEIRNNKRH